MVPTRAPHFAAFCLAASLAVAGLLIGKFSVERLERRYVHLVCPRVNLFLTRSPALQTAALAAPDLLPVYGSSELAMPVPDRAMIFFRDYPSGFEVFPIGQAGTYPLITLQKVAAVAGRLRGRKVVISLSSGWFRHEEMRLDAFQGNFSPLDSCAFIFNSELSPGLKRDAARRLAPLGPLPGRVPVAAFALRQLADSTPFSLAAYWAAWPLGKLQTAILQLQDHFEAWQFIAAQKGRPDAIHREPQSLDWRALIAAASREAGDLPGAVIDPAANDPAPQPGDAVFVAHVAESHLWSDLELLLRALQETGARPFVLSTPFNGPYQTGMHVSRSARQCYYDRLSALVRRFGLPCRDFSEHDADRNFTGDHYDHLTAKGWMIYNAALDDFFHAP